MSSTLLPLRTTLLRSSLPSRSLPRSCRSLHRSRFTPPTSSLLLSRRYSSAHEALNESKQGGVRISHLFGGLAVLGLFVTTYGLLGWYFAFETWPEAVRKDLRVALSAKNRSDNIRSEAAFRRALATAQTLPLTALSPDPLLKLSGISISLSALLESSGQLIPAYDVLSSALAHLDAYNPSRPSSPPARDDGVAEPYTWTEKDQSRSIGLSQKLGALALTLSHSPTALDTYGSRAERHLTRSLEEMIRLATKAGEAGAGGKLVGRDFGFEEDTEGKAFEKGEEGVGEGGKVTRKGMGKTMEALADLYVRRGENDKANVLYVQAISTLLPTPPKELPRELWRKPGVEDRCQAALLMNTLSSSLLHPPTSKNISISKSWSLRSLQIAEQALSDASAAGASDANARAQIGCARARVVGEYNVGVLSEMEGDLGEAVKYLRRSMEHAAESGFRDGGREAREALQRIRGLSK